MPLTFVRGDLFRSRAQTLTNPVNCVGVMGAGLAREFRERFPLMYVDYQIRCEREEVRLGCPYVWRNPSGPWVTDGSRLAGASSSRGNLVGGCGSLVLNFPTKGDPGEPSRLGPIREGLEFVAAHAVVWGITSLAVPALGCGLGRLAWSDVRPLIVRALSALPIPVEVYEP